ncbi:MAG TPA: cyclic nucleotide-binding domain-containing protein [Candidatus Hydrogenedentes bacterium]|nr:cyclic nucleotide-binding domain-containing protein [Candidatus Hydrogenedentota bacterium]HRK34440.1 cyclic nucleotide-binding domain-containing protein [Candidatus Hydrogenedentota bacterium]
MLATKDVKQLISEHEFLRGMDPKHIATMSEFAKLKVVHENEYMFRIGEEADCCYLIRDGCIAIEVRHPSRGPVTIQTLGANKVVGWSWLTEPYKWQFDGRALALTRGVCLDSKQLREACEKDHEFGYQLLSRFVPVIADRLEATRIQLLDLYAP